MSLTSAPVVGGPLQAGRLVQGRVVEVQRLKLALSE